MRDASGEQGVVFPDDVSALYRLLTVRVIDGGVNDVFPSFQAE